MGTVFPPITISNGQKIQYLYQHFSPFFGTFTFYVQFLVFYSTIVSYLLFILYCTTLEVSYLRAAIVQLYRTYSLYYLVLYVSSNLCAVYWYYFSAQTQILCALAAPKKLVTATNSHSQPPLKIQLWRSYSGSDGGAPVLAPANVGPSHPCPTNFPSSPSFPSNQ